MKSRLYTRTGDNGTTSLVGGKRVDKDCARLEAYGTVDELNSWIGMLCASSKTTPERRRQMQQIQNRLFDIGAILATEPESAWQPAPLPPEAVGELEQLIDEVDAQLPPLRSFILPGGTPDAARAHVARTVARRAERRIITLSREARVDAAVVRYVNRLSDLLFALAREYNLAAALDDTPWQKPD